MYKKRIIVLLFAFLFIGIGMSIAILAIYETQYGKIVDYSCVEELLQNETLDGIFPEEAKINYTKCTLEAFSASTELTTKIFVGILLTGFGSMMSILVTLYEFGEKRRTKT